MTIIRIKRGLLKDLKKGVLSEGELGYTTDSKEVFIGDDGGNLTTITNPAIIESLKNAIEGETKE